MTDVEQRVQNALKCMARQCWEQGLAAQAMLEIGCEIDLKLMARDCVVRQHADGRLCDVEGTPALVDPAVCVEPVLAAGRLLNDSAYAAAAARNVEYLLHHAPKTADGARYQLAGASEVWADSLGMGPYVLARAGYVEEAFAFYEAAKKRLFDPETGLCRHKWDEARGAYVQPAHWGVGNGWALVGLMRMVLALQENGDDRAWLAAAEYRQLLDAVLGTQRPDGLFHHYLDDPESFVETEATEMVAYSIYQMVSCGCLPAGGYLERAERARQGVLGKVDELGLVQGCAASPAFEQPGTSPEGQAHFLMMEAARRRAQEGTQISF